MSGIFLLGRRKRATAAQQHPACQLARGAPAPRPQRGPGPPNRPALISLLDHIWPVRRPPFPAVRRRRSRSDGRALFSREQNSATTRRPQTLGSLFPSRSSLSTKTEATAAGHGGRAERAGRRHRGLLAGAHARRRVSAPPSSRPWTEPCSRAPRAPPASRSG